MVIIDDSYQLPSLVGLPTTPTLIRPQSFATISSVPGSLLMNETFRLEGSFTQGEITTSGRNQRKYTFLSPTTKASNRYY